VVVFVEKQKHIIMRNYSRTQEERKERRALKEAQQEIAETNDYFTNYEPSYPHCNCSDCRKDRAYEQSIRSQMRARYEPAIQKIGDAIIQTIFR
jgi:patatin-like phospholipase/acyl hydrolase